MIDKRQRVASTLEPESDLALQEVYTMNQSIRWSCLPLQLSHFSFPTTMGHHRHNLTVSVFVNVVSGTAATVTIHLIPQRKNHAGISRAPQRSTFLWEGSQQCWVSLMLTRGPLRSTTLQLPCKGGRRSTVSAASLPYKPALWSQLALS